MCDVISRVQRDVMRYQDLTAWKQAIDLAKLVYLETQAFPMEERYGLRSQLRRAAVSIASNIAEGKGRTTRGELRHSVGIARGSLLEVETQVVLAHELGFVSDIAFERFTKPTAELGRVLGGLIKALGPRN